MATKTETKAQQIRRLARDIYEGAVACDETVAGTCVFIPNNPTVRIFSQDIRKNAKELLDAAV